MRTFTASEMDESTAMEGSLTCLAMWRPAGSHPLDLMRGLSTMDSAPEYNFMLKPGAHLAHGLARIWAAVGRPRYSLGESVASLLASTRTPSVDARDLHLPYGAQVIEVPPTMTSMPGRGPLYVVVGRFAFTDDPLDADESKTAVVVIAHRDQGDDGVEARPVVRIFDPSESVTDVRPGPFQRKNPFAQEETDAPSHYVEAIRYAINTLLFVAAHRECLVARKSGRTATAETIRDLRPPVGVSVSAQFRSLTRRLISARSISERKACLMHIVRGHWKHQAHGAGRTERTMRWIQPYQRGLADLGRIVEKTVHVAGT